MSPPKLLISESDRFTPAAVDRLRQCADVTLADLDRAALLDSVCDAEVLWVRLRHQIDSEVLDRASRLRFIASPTTGLNHIDLEAADRQGIRVLSLRGEFDFLRQIRATAEHTMGLIFGLLRNLPGAADHVRGGDWDRDQFCGRELHEKTIGVVGYGRLGRLVAHYARAFDSRVLVTDPNVEPNDLPAGVQWVPMESLLAQAEIVTLHVNLCEQTQGFFGKDQFAQMRTNAWLVNTSRGELLDESALLEALSQGKLAGAALDVLAGERSSGMVHHPLVRYAREHRNLLITPHIGGCTTESMAKTEIFLAEKLCAALQESSVRA